MKGNEFREMTKKEMILLMMDGNTLESEEGDNCFFDERADPPFIIKYNPEPNCKKTGGVWQFMRWKVSHKKQDWEDRSLVWCWDDEDLSMMMLHVWDSKEQQVFAHDGLSYDIYENYELYTSDITPKMREMIDNCKSRGVNACDEYPMGHINKLYLYIIDGSLIIEYKGEQIGHINKQGGCYILNDLNKVKAYNEWRKDGMQVNRDSMKWKGGEYTISDLGILSRKDISNGYIYDLRGNEYLAQCGDYNIMRHKYNKKPISF